MASQTPRRVHVRLGLEIGLSGFRIGRPVFAPAGSVLVFVTRKVNADEIASSLESEGHQLGLLHGDMTQGGRDDVITAFRRKEFPILVATDIAGHSSIGS